MVEINLISNLLLEYVSDYSQHPFPEYLRVGIPVALSTDDRGMWDSNMSDEFFVAVKEFNLSWEEIVKLGRNSLQYSFLEEPTKQRLLTNYDKRIAAFALQFQKKSWAALGESKPVSYGFLCTHYKLCLLPQVSAAQASAAPQVPPLPLTYPVRCHGSGTIPRAVFAPPDCRPGTPPRSPAFLPRDTPRWCSTPRSSRAAAWNNCSPSAAP
jgi:hypothetical protein